MSALRRHYGERLTQLEDDVLAMGARVVEMIPQVMRALEQRDEDAANSVIRTDDEVDETYAAIQEQILTTLALEAPVASELRLLAALIHVNIHVERIGDYCVNIAKFVGLMHEHSADTELMAQLQEMGGHASNVAARSLEAFSRRDLELAYRLPDLDDPLDRLNKGLFRRLVALAAEDESRLDWAMGMVLVARYLERLGDHAVDIAEQAVFVMTGDIVELESRGLT